MSDEIKRKVRELYRQGYSCQEILVILPVSKSVRTFNRWVKEFGLSRKSGGSKYKYPKIMIEAIELYKKGLSTREIAEKFSIKRPTVSKWMRDLGIARSRGAQMGGQKGKKNPNWKNGASLRNYGIRKTKEYQEWRMRVFERDSFKCCSCEEVGRELHAHHILSFIQYPLLRIDTNNGITLCKKCHLTLHGKYKEKSA